MNKLFYSLIATAFISTGSFAQTASFHELLNEAQELESTNPRRAIELYYEASQMNHPEVAEAYFLKGKFFLSMGNHPAAVADFETAMNAGTYDFTLADYEVIGDAYLMNGKSTEACEIWNSALDGDESESTATQSVKGKIEANCQ